jgi:signal transduction histidine kinase
MNAATLIDAREQERHRLSRELHDGVGQHLALLSADLAALRELLCDSPPALERLRRLLTHTEEIGAEVHRVCRDLLPLSLERLGLVGSIRRICAELSSAHRIRIHVDAGDLPDQIDPHAVLCLYRIAQEALSNVAKHSQAATAAVRLEANTDEIVLHIVDDGRGFDPAVARQLNGLGLVSMRERAHHAGGDVALAAKPGQGTRVQARIPLAARAAEYDQRSAVQEPAPLPAVADGDVLFRRRT